jgi:hypothetical protein
MDSPTHFEGEWLEFSGGQTMAGPYRSPTPRSLGRVAIDFSTLDQGTITFTEGTTIKQLKRATAKSPKTTPHTRMAPVLPQFTGPVWLDDEVFWPHFQCSLSREIVTVSEAGTTGTYSTTESATYHVLFDYIRGSFGHYRLNDSESRVNYNYATLDTSNGCTQNAHQDNIGGLSGPLDIKPIGLTYRALVYAETVHGIPITGSCGPGTPRLPDLAFPMNSRSSTIQAASPYPSYSSSKLPFMSVTDSHSETDGSRISVHWECVAF